MNKITYLTKQTLFLFAILSLNACKCDEKVWYKDSDADGFGDLNVSQSACDQPEGYVENSSDLDDSNASINPNSVWQGSKIIFTKIDGADWTLPENQDNITNAVAITRASNQGIFNIAVESQYEDFESPVDTEWAIGTTSNLGSLTFNDWETAVSDSLEGPPSAVGVDMVVHLISDNIYIDIKFLSWASGGQGGQGGFSYERSTKN